VGLLIGDGNNRITIRQAGGNKRVFNHADGPVDWQQLVVDTSILSQLNTDGVVVVKAGSFANLNTTALTQFGGDYHTLSKALGGGYNTATDIIRVGNDGLTVTAGTSGSPGRFIEIVQEDRSTANLKAHGIIREYSTNLYGIQGPLTIGAATGNTWFEGDGFTLAYENRFIANDKYYFRVQGGTGNTTVFLRNGSITTAGPFVTVDFSSNNIDSLIITGTTFNQLGNPVIFATDSIDDQHMVGNSTFQGCGQVRPGTSWFRNNTIANSTDHTTGAMLLDANGTTNMENLSFISGGQGHAIYITAPGTYDFTDFNFTGYGANNTTDACIYNDSGGLVTVNILGGSGATFRNGTGATTNVINASSVTLTGLAVDTEIRIFEAGTTTEVAGIENSGTSFQYTFNYPTGYNVDIVIHNLNYKYLRLNNFVLPSQPASVPIQQIPDRYYQGGIY
jgi:hypothetical protein